MKFEINNTLENYKYSLDGKLYKQLKKNNIFTIEQVLLLNPNEFKRFKGVGAKTVKELLSFQNSIRISCENISNNDSTNSINLNLFDNELLNRNIDDLQGLFPNLLINFFKKHGFLTIKSTLSIHEKYLNELKGFGRKKAKMYQEYLNDFSSNHQNINDHLSNFSLNLLPKKLDCILANDGLIPLNIIECIIRDYFDLKPYFERDRDIVFRRFGIDFKRIYKFEELATYYNVSRERIRQIQNNKINILKKLLTLYHLLKPKCEISKDAQIHIDNFRELFRNVKIRNMTNIKIEIYKKYNFSLNQSKIPLLKMVLSIYGYDFFEIRREIIFFNENTISKNTLVLISDSIYNILLTNITPTTEFDLIIIVKKKFKGISLNEDLIISIIKELPNIEEKTLPSGEKIYEATIDILRTIGDKAFAILYKNQKVMHYSEIDKEIKRYYLKHGNTFNKNIISGQRLSRDNRFSSYGKSGHWGLSEWKFPTKSIIDIIHDAFIEQNKPLNIDEVFRYVKEKRSIVTKKTIYSILYDHSFIKLIDKRYIPVSWNDKYYELVEKKRHSKASTINLKEELYKYYLQNNTNIIKWTEVKHDIQRITNLQEKNLYNRLSKCNILIKIKKDGHIYFQLDLSKESNNILTQKTKKQMISDDAYNIVKNSKDECITHGKLVKSLANKYPRGSIYPAIKKDNRLITFNESNIFYVKLNEIKSDRKFAFWSDIMKGETQQIEFKSSLYWDFKLHEKNSNLADSVLKTIVAFLNTEGGTLYIGVNNDKKIIGLSDDLKLYKNSCDIYLQTIDNLIHARIGSEINHYIKIQIEDIGSDKICVISISPASSPVYLKSNSDTLFFIRLSSSTRELNTKDTVSYIQKHWNL